MGTDPIFLSGCGNLRLCRSGVGWGRQEGSVAGREAWPLESAATKSVFPCCSSVFQPHHVLRRSDRQERFVPVIWHNGMDPIPFRKNFYRPPIYSGVSTRSCPTRVAFICVRRPHRTRLMSWRPNTVAYLPRCSLRPSPACR